MSIANFELETMVQLYKYSLNDHISKRLMPYSIGPVFSKSKVTSILR